MFEQNRPRAPAHLGAYPFAMHEGLTTGPGWGVRHQCHLQLFSALQVEVFHVQAFGL
jgi:hypothetical protein